MSELVKRTKHLCYREYFPKISSIMDPKMVQLGQSYAALNHIVAVEKNFLPRIADGTPYLGHNGEDTVGEYTQAIYSLPIPNAKVLKLIRNDKYRGNYLEYGNSRVVVRQCHFASLLVVLGQSIKADFLIGYEGKTGAVTGKHLHTSILIDGKYVDPRWYVTGQVPFPNDIADEYKTAVKASDGYWNWPNTDKWEIVIPVESYRVDTSGPSLRVRKSPGSDKEQVGLLSNGTTIYIDRMCVLPDGQLWARLKDKPWNWVCLKRGVSFATKLKQFPDKLVDGYYYVRKTFDDFASQEGAYKILSNARKQAKALGLKVFDPDGREVI